MSRHRARNAASSASGSSARSSSKSLIQPSPMCSEMSCEGADCDSTIQRRGVTPLVLLLNFCGHSS